MSQIKDELKQAEYLQKLPIIGARPKSEKEETYLREICEFEFSNLEESNLAVKFPYGNAKAQHNFTFFPGGKYRIPRCVAKWVESRSTPIWEWRPDGNGSLKKKLIGNKPRFQMRETFGG